MFLRPVTLPREPMLCLPSATSRPALGEAGCGVGAFCDTCESGSRAAAARQLHVVHVTPGGARGSTMAACPSQPTT